MRDQTDLNNRILVTRSSIAPLDEYVEEIRDIWDTHWMTNMGINEESNPPAMLGRMK